MINYTVYHCHTMLSNGTTNIDSVTNYKEYVELAQKCGMTAFGFSEHGNIYEWLHKKECVEKAGMKYIHAEEFYVTEQMQDLIRDNYHCVLIAKNYEGFKELNRLSSIAYQRDGHFYYTPRITLDELFQTSDNIIITTACVASILGKGEQSLQDSFLHFLTKNKHRCFLEIQHHNTQKQIIYNLKLKEISDKTGIPLIAGTDTHCLNHEHEAGRVMLQRGKKTFFEGEEGWDLVFKTYDELVEAYKEQNCLDEDVFLQAIQNTNVMADMIEPFVLTKEFKYPKIYENADEVLLKKLYKSAKEHPYLLKRHSWEEVKTRIDEEFETYKAINSSSYMLLEDHVMNWCHNHDIYTGPARGSVSGALTAYALGITEMDSLKFDLKFWRFMHKDKYSLPDIDCDYGEADRDKVKYYLLHDHMELPNIQTAEIITFNTIALKGAIKDIGRAMNLPLDEVDAISKAVHEITMDENKVTVIDDEWRERYPELFRYVDIVQGTITSVGSHPSGVLITDKNIAEELGVCYLKGDEYPVCCLNMKELDSLNYVKLDILGLSNISIINDTCKLVGIDRINPDNIDLEDVNVWKSIRDDTSLIFQWNSNYGAQTMSKLFSDTTVAKIKQKYPDIKYLDLFSFGNALIRPCGKGQYDSAVQGIITPTGIKEIDNLLSSELNRCLYQEDIMQFTMDFCGYSFLQADKLRKIIGKKLGTRSVLPEVRSGFENNAKVLYNLSDEESEAIIAPILDGILDASRYSFSKNHAYAYSCIGYECGWLRYYYPVEFITTCLNIFAGDEDKTNEAVTYARKIGVRILPPKFRYARAEYQPNPEQKVVYKGMKSIKFMNNQVAEDLYNLRDKKYNSFIELLYDLKEISINSRQLDILIKLDFFEEFGNSKTLLKIVECFDKFKQGDAKSIKKEKLVNDNILNGIVKRHSVGVTKSGKESASYSQLDCFAILNECEEYLKGVGIKDFSYKEKANTQLEYFGYIGILTNKKEDRPKLIVLNVKPLIAKKTNRKWATQIEAQSIGSGIKNTFTILNRHYSEALNKFDVIYCEDVEKQGNYWHINKYHRMVGV